MIYSVILDLDWVTTKTNCNIEIYLNEKLEIEFTLEIDRKIQFVKNITLDRENFIPFCLK